MTNLGQISTKREGNQFERRFSKGLSRIGTGSIGGKAQGLAFIHDVLMTEFDSGLFPDVEVFIPTQFAVCTDVFDEFMRRNKLYDIALSDASDDRIARAFQRADLPFEVLGDLRTIVETRNTPLAIRSSSLLEDRLYVPFAGVYATKMTPNNQSDASTRFSKLVEAIKFVYASTFFRSAKDYITATKNDITEEKMGVIIQDVVGKKYGGRFYPEVSGVARSYNHYPMGRAKPEEGVVSLALGLGKTIVDGGISWTYAPSYPKVDPPYRTVRELLTQSQTEFWAVNMGKPPAYDPTKETEYLLFESITAAEEDGSLRYSASTYNAYADRLTIGTGMKGPRVLTFAPLLVLEEIPINNIVKSLLAVSEATMENPVEIEFAMTINPHRLGFLQVRPMAVFSDEVDIYDEELTSQNVLTASNSVLGNGVINYIHDIVYVKPESFDFKHSRAVVPELARVNRKLAEAGQPYLLYAIGRLGTTDPWLGIPVIWGQVSGAKVIVEATKEDKSVELSQGSHFFHNLIGMGMSYFTVPQPGEYPIDWDWLNEQEAVEETDYIRHVRLPAPLLIRVDGRRGRGVIYKF